MHGSVVTIAVFCSKQSLNARNVPIVRHLVHLLVSCSLEPKRSFICLYSGKFGCAAGTAARLSVSSTDETFTWYDDH